MLFEDVAAQLPFARNTESFYNPKITKVEVTIEGIPNQLFSQGMPAYQMWDEARKLFAASPSRKRHPEEAVVAKDLGLDTPGPHLFGQVMGRGEDKGVSGTDELDPSRGFAAAPAAV